MSLFTEAIDNKNKKINRYANKFARKMDGRIRKSVKQGEFSAEMEPYDAGLYLSEQITNDVFKRTIDILNNHYKGEVVIEIDYYDSGKYKGLKANVIKTEIENISND